MAEESPTEDDQPSTEDQPPTDNQPSAAQKWINPDTGNPIFTRFNTETLEKRTQAASDLYREGHYRTIQLASTKLGVPYSRLYSRIQGSHLRSQNGGNRTLLTKAEEEAIFDWARDQLVQVKRVQSGEVLRFTIEMLRAEGRTVEPSKSWAKRFIRRHRDGLRVKKPSKTAAAAAARRGVA